MTTAGLAEAVSEEEVWHDSSTVTLRCMLHACRPTGTKTYDPFLPAYRHRDTMEQGTKPGSKFICDMEEHGEMKNDAMNTAALAMEQHDEERAISKHIKMHFDGKYGPTWHCIVGSDFRAFVTHEAKNFIFFYVGKRAVCLYKAG